MEVKVHSHTSPSHFDSVAGYGIILNEHHFKDLLLDYTTPPAIQTAKSSTGLIMIGFPSRIQESTSTLCACHSTFVRGGYHCPRCSSKVCSLPAECPTCNLTLVLSTHLARSYHHLFPVLSWSEVPWSKYVSTSCISILIP